MLHEIDVLRSTPSTIKGTRMQSTVFKQDIFRFKRYLNVNATLTIVNPSLGSNASNYKVIDCPNKLVLNSSTHVNPCNQFDGPTFGFKFYSFKSVIHKEIPLKATTDIIGHVVHVFKDNNSYMRDVKKSARLTMEVSDISGDSVYVTLWGDYVSQFSKYVVEHFDKSHMIILMQFGRVKYHKEKPYVSNSYGSDVTHVFMNDSISEIEDYRTRLFEFLELNVDGPIRRPIHVKLMSTLDEEFLMVTSFFNICEICTLLQPKSIIVLWTIKVVCPDSEWYYVGCNSCSRKVSVTVVEGKDVYECKNQRCNTLGVTPTPSGVVSLTLFDRDAKLIINKTTSELFAAKDEDDVGLGGFPGELNCLLVKKFAFKVEIADFNFRNNVEVYGISKLTDDQQIISAIEKRIMPEFIVPSDSGSLTFGNSLTDLQSTSSASLKISENGDNKTPISYPLVDEELNEIKLSSSDSDDKLKRKLVDVFYGDQPSAFPSSKSKTGDVQGDSEFVNVVGTSKNGVKLLTPKVEK
ncbi:replication protein A 70 kDa DNA-binding subunit A-like [Bidens hawaiensis]|uniref:replication protein A 70 kDa DNA-binding subunit A-like n=1 Tax=Bidens hawaiensis TaxID=980011 RepID=UPI0040496AFF